MTTNESILLECMDFIDDDMLIKAMSGMEKLKKQKLIKRVSGFAAGAAAVIALLFFGLPFLESLNFNNVITPSAQNCEPKFKYRYLETLNSYFSEMYREDGNTASTPTFSRIYDISAPLDMTASNNGVEITLTGVVFDGQCLYYTFNYSFDDESLYEKTPYFYKEGSVVKPDLPIVNWNDITTANSDHSAVGCMMFNDFYGDIDTVRIKFIDLMGDMSEPDVSIPLDIDFDIPLRELGIMDNVVKSEYEYYTEVYWYYKATATPLCINIDYDSSLFPISYDEDLKLGFNDGTYMNIAYGKFQFLQEPGKIDLILPYPIAPEKLVSITINGEEIPLSDKDKEIIITTAEPMTEPESETSEEVSEEEIPVDDFFAAVERLARESETLDEFLEKLKGADAENRVSGVSVVKMPNEETATEYLPIGTEITNDEPLHDAMPRYMSLSLNDGNIRVISVDAADGTTLPVYGMLPINPQILITGKEFELPPYEYYFRIPELYPEKSLKCTGYWLGVSVSSYKMKFVFQADSIGSVSLADATGDGIRDVCAYAVIDGQETVVIYDVAEDTLYKYEGENPVADSVPVIDGYELYYSVTGAYNEAIKEIPVSEIFEACSVFTPEFNYD